MRFNLIYQNEFLKESSSVRISGGQHFFPHDLWSQIALTSDGETYALGAEDGTVVFAHNVHKGGFHFFETHELASVCSLVFHPQGQLLASGHGEGTIRVWDIEGNKPGPFWGTKASIVHTLDFSPDGKSITAGCSDGGILIIDLVGSCRIHDRNYIVGSINSVAFSPDGELIASGGEDSIVRLWQSNDLGQKPVELVGHEAAVQSLAFSPDGKTLASAGKTIHLWDVQKRKELYYFRVKDFRSVMHSLAFDTSGRRFISASKDSAVYFWDLAQRETISIWEARFQKSAPDSLSALAFKAGKLALVSPIKQGVFFFDVGFK